MRASPQPLPPPPPPQPAVNRGYVLDAYPKAAGQARWAFMALQPLSAQELAEKEQVRAVRGVP